jgi:hypothetical protein
MFDWAVLACVQDDEDLAGGLNSHSYAQGALDRRSVVVSGWYAPKAINDHLKTGLPESSRA